MGYLVVIVLALALLALLAIGLTGMAPHTPRHGQLPSDRPVQRDKPSADEANPADSVTASSAQKEAARRRTPPA